MVIVPSAAARPAVAARVLACFTLALLALSVMAGVVSAVAVTRYVDCVAGNDANTGISTSAAWKSLSKASAAVLAPGDKLLLKRGCTWTGPLTAKWRGTALLPITIGAYGTGELPKIQNAPDNVIVYGSYLVLENLYTRANPPAYDAGCQNNPMGWRVGFRFMSGASYNTLRYSKATELYFGIYLASGSHHTRVLSNVLQKNNMKSSDVNSDAGAVAIAVSGDDNEIAFNDISGTDACSRFYVRDGAAVEIYGGQRNSVHHNVSREDNNFTELGNSRSADNTFAYNRVTSSLAIANFLVTKGSGGPHGPVYRTKAYNNTVYLWGSQSYAVLCQDACSSSILSLRNNIIWSQDRVGYSSAAFDEGYNIYWNASGTPKIYFPITSTSRRLDPRFVNRSGLDLHVTSTSPAIDKASTAAFNLGYKTDLDGIAVPQAAAVDVGGYERPATIVYAADSFTRTVANGWGGASTGGSYSLSGYAGDFGVTGAVGTIRAAPGVTRAARLPAVAALDTDATFRVSMDRLAAGSGTYIYFAARQNSTAGNEYRVKLRFASGGTLYLQGTKVLANLEGAIGAEVASGTAPAAGSFVRVRAQVVGANPTTLRAKVWVDGQAEPAAWQMSGTDAAAALQTLSGGVGVRLYVSSSASAASVASFDDFRVLRP
jgi:hypothetical protein